MTAFVRKGTLTTGRGASSRRPAHLLRDTPPRLSSDDARLLPRVREDGPFCSSGSVLDGARMRRAQAVALRDAGGSEPGPRPVFLKEAQSLRGIPVIGSGAGACPGTNPEDVIDRIDWQREQRRKTVEVAVMVGFAA